MPLPLLHLVTKLLLLVSVSPKTESGHIGPVAGIIRGSKPQRIYTAALSTTNIQFDCKQNDIHNMPYIQSTISLQKNKSV